MNTCDTCKHWGPETEQPVYWESEVRVCHSGKIVPAHFGKESDCVVVSEDYASAFSINTGPKFGCIHHEAK